MRRVKAILAIIVLCNAANAQGNSGLEAIFSKELAAKIKSLSADHILILVWNPFCEPCGGEVHEINKALESIKKTGTTGKEIRLRVIGIPIRSRETEIKAFIDHFKPNFEQWRPDTEFQKKFLKPVPWTVLIAKNRGIAKEWIGSITAQEVLNVIGGYEKKIVKKNF